MPAGVVVVEALLAQEWVDLERVRHDHLEFPSGGITAQLVERWRLSRPLVPLMP